MKKPNADHVAVGFSDHAEIVVTCQPREEVLWRLVREPFPKRIGITPMIERAQFRDRATQYIGRRLGVSWMCIAHGKHSATLRRAKPLHATRPAFFKRHQR